MAGLREFVNERPWIAWVIAGAAVLVAIALATGGIRFGDRDPVERMSEEVTIRCTETGEEWTMNRGEFERLLMTTPGATSPEGGIPSPHAEGRLTGVLVDKDDWEETVTRINKLKEAYSD